MKSGGRWEARFSIDSSRLKLGTFETEEEAALAYDSKARQHPMDGNGQRRKLNFPTEDEQQRRIDTESAQRIVAVRDMTSSKMVGVERRAGVLCPPQHELLRQIPELFTMPLKELRLVYTQLDFSESDIKFATGARRRFQNRTHAAT